MAAAAQQGAALQTYNNELVKALDELSHRRRALQKEIDRDEQEKASLETQMRSLKAKLDVVSASLNERLEMRDKYDRTITESEAAYQRILESSQVLLGVVKKDAKDLEQKGGHFHKGTDK